MKLQKTLSETNRTVLTGKNCRIEKIRSSRLRVIFSVNYNSQLSPRMQQERRVKKNFVSIYEEDVEMATPSRASMVTSSKVIEQPDNGVQTLRPPTPVVPADGGNLRERKITEGNILPNDNAAQNSSLSQIESNREIVLSVRF